MSQDTLCSTQAYCSSITRKVTVTTAGEDILIYLIFEGNICLHLSCESSTLADYSHEIQDLFTFLRKKN